jgi:hypothetical protein
MTRFYLPSAGAASISPSPAAAWTAIGAAIYVPLVRGKTGSAKFYQSVMQANTVTDNVLCAVYVSEPLGAQTVTGNWTMVMSCYESNVAMNSSLQMTVRVLSGNGSTVRGTVYAGHSAATTATVGALGEEMSSVDDFTRIIPSQAGSSVTAQAGDVLVVEIGFRAANTVNTVYQAELDLGDNQAADYALTSGVSGRTSDAWVETSQALTFLTTPAAISAGGGTAGWGGRSTGIKTVAAWETDFLTVYASNHTSIYNPLSLTGISPAAQGDSWDHYNLAYGFDGVLAMFQATGNTAYLDRCILYANNLVSKARVSSAMGGSAYGDAYLGWVSQRVDVIGQEVPLFELFCWRHVVRMLRIIKDTPALLAAYASTYATLLAFVETNIWDKWWTRDSTNLGLTPPHGGSYAFYRSVTNIASHAAWIGMNLKVMTANSARQTNCQAVKDNIDFAGYPSWAADGPVGANLRSQLGQIAMPGDPAAYNWYSFWNSVDPLDIQDISHASAEVGYILDSWEKGQYWTSVDASKFMRGFTNHILAPNGTHSSNVDGTGGAGGYLPDGMINFGRYDAQVQRRLQAIGPEADNLGGTTQWYGKMALNARYLLGR